MLNKEQSRRILEDVQRLALAMKLVQEEVDAIIRDIGGMIHGNDKDSSKKSG